MAVRDGTEADLPAMVQLSGRVRERLEHLEPVFWRRHPDADHAQMGWFGLLLADDAHHVLVSTDDHDAVDGFVIARAMDAPPVYDPGGRTCMIDDFVWAAPAVADALVDGVRQWAASRHCTQMIVVTPAADAERKALLERTGLHSTSEWWTGPI